MYYKYLYDLTNYYKQFVMNNNIDSKFMEEFFQYSEEKEEIK